MPFSAYCSYVSFYHSLHLYSNKFPKHAQKLLWTGRSGLQPLPGNAFQIREDAVELSCVLGNPVENGRGWVLAAGELIHGAVERVCDLLDA